jgi:flagellar motor switch protein FliM
MPLVITVSLTFTSQISWFSDSDPKMANEKKALTQQEIDALLAILPTDGSPLPGALASGSPARIYDFRSPDKFSKEQIRTLQMIHETFARRISSSLSVYLRTMVQLTLVHIEQGSFVDFIVSVPAPSPVAVLKMDPLPGRILLTLDSTIATITVDRLLGGFGRAVGEGHQITDIEQTLLHGVFEYANESLQEAWRNVIGLKVTTEETALNPEFLQVALPTDPAVFLGFEVKIREDTGRMSICIPYPVLKPIASELSPHTWVAGEAREAGVYREALLQHLKRAQVELAVLLGEVNADFEGLLNLQKGDVLVLDTAVGQPLPMLIGHCKKYLAQPGLSGSYMGVKIISTLEEACSG